MPASPITITFTTPITIPLLMSATPIGIAAQHGNKGTAHRLSYFIDLLGNMSKKELNMEYYAGEAMNAACPIIKVSSKSASPIPKAIFPSTLSNPPCY